MKNKVQIEDLEKKSKETLIDDLEKCRYSILDSIGCRKIRLEMFIPGLISAIIVRFLCWIAKLRDGENWPKTVRNYIIKLFRRFAGYRIYRDDKLPDKQGGLIIGFNHPSLGEILRLISLVSKEYPDNSYLFPVNLPWFEALCPVIGKMREAGFYLTPIITPSTRNKIESLVKKDIFEQVYKIGKAFNNTYIELCQKFVQSKDIILVAPCATRQTTVFKTDEALCQKTKVEPQTLSLLVQTIARQKNATETMFLPVAVVPPSDFNKGLNLQKFYTFGICKAIDFAEAISLSKQTYTSDRGRKLDFEFLRRISLKLFEMGEYDFIAPLETDESIDGLSNLFPNKVASP